MNERTDEIMQELTEEEMEIIAGGVGNLDEDDDRVEGKRHNPPIRFLPEGMTPEILREMMKLNNKLYKEGRNANVRGVAMYKYANEHGAKMDERSAYWFAKVRGIPDRV